MMVKINSDNGEEKLYSTDEGAVRKAGENTSVQLMHLVWDQLVS